MPIPYLIWVDNAITKRSLENHIKTIHSSSAQSNSLKTYYAPINIIIQSLENHMEQSTSQLYFGYDPIHLNGKLKYKSNIRVYYPIH